MRPARLLACGMALCGGALLATPAALAQPRDDKHSAPGPQRTAPGDPTLVVRGATYYGFRRYTYSEALDEFFSTIPPLRSYELDHGVGVGIQVEVYPFNSSTGPRSVQPGIDVSYRQEGLLANSMVAEVPVDVTSHQWQVGARVRIPVAQHQIGLWAGVGSHSFSLASATRTPEPVGVPNVSWTYFRAAVDGRLAVSPLFIGATAGYRAPFAAGEIGSYAWFPRLTVGGIDATVYVGAPLSDNFELSLGYELRRYVFSAHSKPGDTAVAGGAVDLYGSGWLALAFVF